MQRVDSLGRKIPTFNRSAAGKKAAQTRKERYGSDIHARVGRLGGNSRTRGYFGKLKDEGKTDELKKISEEAIKAKRQKSKKRTADSGDD